MELVRGVHNLSAKHTGCVLTIGKFDGVHLGHQAVLKRLKQKANEMQLPSAVMVFEPQPEEVFAPIDAPARLSTLRDKATLLAEQGIDRLICIRFDKRFAALSPEAFIRDLLVEKLGIQYLVVGDDFRFGRKRAGDFAMLLDAGKREQFDVVNTASFRLHDSRISSTAIRESIEQNEFEIAHEMLGRPFSISGKVIHGNKKGRTIGFPTANVLLNRCRSPLQGVFAVTVTLGTIRYFGVANIGSRPTIDGTRVQLEVHIFKYSGDLYGKRIDVTPISKIRDEIKFNSFDELKKQISLDAEKALTLLTALFDDVITESEN
ncbi:bifunctional riboflavin kinase/FAD synthetase [Alteromonas sp. 5E99-2]|uniref:bifunctional riboflavin kinase/FAD synthetase n=1 Tax=Alteromonas sp. 5E99-2 TaxID=2817683 RepID=UPI001A99AE36|nr:bifunctional riboflavin kinase/FAD synthetase [Alteromonas sp. 5E99-2]